MDPTSSTPNTTTVPEGTKPEDVPAWGKAIQEAISRLAVQTDKRLDGFAAKIGGKPTTGEAPAANASASVTQSDLDASIRFGELRGSLPEAQRVQLEALRQDGLGFAQLVRVAEGFKAALPSATSSANGGGTAERSAPPGVAANAALSTAPRFPTRQSEMLALKVSDLKAFNAIWDHPDFDPRLLRKD